MSLQYNWATLFDILCISLQSYYIGGWSQNLRMYIKLVLLGGLATVSYIDIFSQKIFSILCHKSDDFNRQQAVLCYTTLGGDETRLSRGQGDIIGKTGNVI